MSMKFGIFSVCMPEFEPIESFEKAAEIGYKGMEWRVTADNGDRANPSFWSGNRTSMTAEKIIENAAELKKKAASLGMEMPSLGTYIGCADLEVVELHMKAAVAIGARCIRVSPGGYNPEQSFAEQFKFAREQYFKIEKLAAKYRVKSLIETHMGQLGPSVYKAVQILEGMDPDCVGIMWDPGNQVSEGGETYPMAIDIAGPYLAEVHVKNIKFISEKQDDGSIQWRSVSCPVNEGIVNWPAVIAELKKVDYHGWLFLEDFSTEKPLLEKLTMDFRYISGLLA